MMTAKERVIFILNNKKTYRRGVRIFIKGKDGKYVDRLLNFTTEHKVDEKQRATVARTLHAEYVTNNPEEIHALYSGTAYGKDFWEQGDEAGEKRIEGRVIKEEDTERIALRNLFKAAGMPFDANKNVKVLKEEYGIHVGATMGVNIIGPGTATSIPHIEVDLKQQMEDAKESARKAYEKKYGEQVPAIVFNDITFLDGMSNPKFNATAYIDEKRIVSEDAGDEKPIIKDDGPPEGNTETKEHLLEAYKNKFKVNCPNAKRNDLAWIKTKLDEE